MLLTTGVEGGSDELAKLPASVNGIQGLVQLGMSVVKLYPHDRHSSVSTTVGLNGTAHLATKNVTHKAKTYARN
jgi:hypothetical protein